MSRFCKKNIFDTNSLQSKVNIKGTKFESRILDSDYIQTLMEVQETVYRLPSAAIDNTTVTVKDTNVFDKGTISSATIFGQLNMVPAAVPKN